MGSVKKISPTKGIRDVKNRVRIHSRADVAGVQDLVGCRGSEGR
jgi:hypothetical protein